MLFRFTRRSSIIAQLTWLLLLVYSASPTFACSPADPTPWFREQLSVERRSFPPGVTVASTGTHIQIGNQSSIPLYLVSTSTETMPLPDQLDSLPPGRIIWHKIVDGRSFTWEREYEHTRASSSWSWAAVSGTPSSHIRLSVYRNLFHSQTTTIQPLDPRNPYDEVRPSTPVIPAAQMISVTLLYGKQEINVPVTIRYQLNPDYDPLTVERARNACGSYDLFASTDPLTLWFVMSSAVGLLCSPLLLLVALLERRRRKPSEPPKL